MNEPDPNSSLPGDDRWARDALTKLAFAAVAEQRRARRWGIFFKLLFFGYLVALLALAWPDNLTTVAATAAKPHTALVHVDGLISGSTEASAKNVIEALRKAFKDKNTVGVIVEIDSPGGSPVQAGEIYDEIQKLRQHLVRLKERLAGNDFISAVELAQLRELTGPLGGDTGARLENAISHYDYSHAKILVDDIMNSLDENLIPPRESA